VFERRFRPELKAAFGAWLATSPFTNPDAPPGPQVMPQYKNATAEKAAHLEEESTHAYEEALVSRRRAESYLRNTLLLAIVLFLGALAPRFKLLGVRIGLVVVAVVLLAIALYNVAAYPVA
jgi:hypothetical protein